MGESLAFIGPWQYVQKIFIVKSERLYPENLRRKFPVHEVAKILGNFWKRNYRDFRERINETIRYGLEVIKDILGESQIDDPEEIINQDSLDPEMLELYTEKFSRCPYPPTSIIMIGEWQYVQKAFLIKAEELYPTTLRKRLPIHEVAKILSPYWSRGGNYACIGDKINYTIKAGLEDLKVILQRDPEIEDAEEIIDLDVTLPEVVNLIGEKFDFGVFLNWNANPPYEEEPEEPEGQEEQEEQGEQENPGLLNWSINPVYPERKDNL